MMSVVFGAFLYLMCMSSIGVQGIDVFYFKADSTSGSLEVEQGSTVNFVCKAQGPTPPQLTIRGQRSNVTLPLTYTPRGDTNSTGEANAMMYCNSTDVYVCTPSIQMNQGVSRNVSVNVRCAPALNTSSGVHKYVSTSKGKTLEIRFNVNAYPPPTSYNLVKTGNETVIPDRRKREASQEPSDFYSVTYIPMQPPQGVVVLKMHGLNTKDSGQYSLSIQNGVGGGLEVNFSVNVKKEDDEDDDMDIHAIIGSVCGIIGVIGLLVPAIYCGVKKCRTKA